MVIILGHDIPLGWYQVLLIAAITWPVYLPVATDLAERLPDSRFDLDEVDSISSSREWATSTHHHRSCICMLFSRGRCILGVPGNVLV